jgi:hypothetical protein
MVPATLGLCSHTSVSAKLNYLLIHERVVPSISFCLSCRGGTPQVIDFLVEMLTLTQLRGQNHLFRSVLALTTFAGRMEFPPWRSLALMSDPRFLQRSLGGAGQSAPGEGRF